MNSAPSAPYRLTFCYVEDELLHICGIVDHDRYECIESILEMNNDRLAQGMCAPQSNEDLANGRMVLVKCGQQFKRGCIVRCESPPFKTFKIRLLDVGSYVVATFDDIRTISGIPHFRGVDNAPCAQDFILSDALIKPDSWSIEDHHWANRTLRTHADVKVTCVVAGNTLISCPVFEGQKLVLFSSLLAQRGLAEVVPYNTVRTIVMRKYISPSFPAVPPPRISPGMTMRHPYAQTSPEMMPTIYSPLGRAPPGLGTHPRHPWPRPAPHQEIRARQFKVDTLPVGTQHEVYVTHVNDGPQSFMIQLKRKVLETLTKLMAQINDITPEPIDQLLVGTMCLGRYSEDKSLCRAVVSMILADGAHLLFVDFGTTETVSFNEIYKIPPQFIEEPIMALGFTLAGLSNYPALNTQEARKIFHDLVTNANHLLMVVTKPEIQLKQYCDLYICDEGSKVNIKKKVLDKVKLMKPAEYQKLSFKQNSSNDVIVSYVESPIRFFVQLEVNQPLLDTLMASVEEYCVTSEMKDFLYVEDVNENMAVCCQYTDDNKWYRGLIAEEPYDDGKVAVFYVDYGNQDIVHFSKLRIMNNEMISKLPMQAVECRLDIDADFALKEEVIQAFVDLVDLNTYKMKVINVLPANVLLVDLFNEQEQNIKDLMLQMFNQGEVISPSVKSTVSPNAGNWRECKNSPNVGDFSAFRREDTQQRSYNKVNDSDDRSRRHSDFKRQDSRGVDEIDDAARFSNKENSSSDRWPHDCANSSDRSGKRSFRNEWSGKSNARDEDRFSIKSRDEDAGRRYDRDGEGHWNNSRERDRDHKSFRRQDDGDSRGGGRRDDDGGEKKPYRRRDESGSRSSRDGDFKKPFNRDDRRGGGGYRKNDDDWNRSKSDWNDKEKNEDEGSGSGKKTDSSWSGRKNDSDWGSKKNDSYENVKNSNDSDWNNKKNDDWNNKRNDDWKNKKKDDWNNKKNDDWKNKKNDDWNNKKNDSDDWGGKKNDSDWKGNSKFDRDDRRPRRDGDYKPRDGGFNSRDGPRQRGGGFGAQNDGYKSKPLLSDGYPAGSKIAESDFHVGQQMEVAISWFLNPIHFYLIPTDNADFRRIMETMQPDYPQRKNAELSSLSSGDFVVARDKDDVIYRAKVIQTRPGGATISFVDYGNNESVSRDQIWTISSDHCLQNAQAVCCGLYNISSTGEGGQWSLPTSVEKYFGKEKYIATFVKCHEEASSKTWFVNLVDENNADIADLLVADGFAVKNTVLKSEELYDIELLRDQILFVFPGHIESSKKFFVHIEPAKAEMIQASIATLAETPDLLQSVPVETICEGEFCLAMADDEVFYRAQILSVNEEEKLVHILYIDYGDENDTTFDAIKKLPENLMIYNPQIFECCLHDAESFDEEDAFQEALKEKDFMIKVMDVIDNKLSVFVYDMNGARLPYPVKIEESVEVLCPLPILRTCEKVFITHITSNKVYLSRTADIAYITDMCVQLKQTYDSEELSKIPVEPGVFYAAKSKIYEAWYRCILPSIDCQEVYYIDYGNTEPVEDLLAVKLLDKSFFESPAYCVAASTSIKFTCAELTSLVEYVAEVVFNATFKKQTDGWFVDLKCEKTDKSFADFATENGCSFEQTEKKINGVQKPYVAFSGWQLNEEKKVIVSHVVSPSKFYLQPTGDVEKIKTMQESLQHVVQRSLPLVGPVDGLCAMQKSDGQWCRAKVLDKQDAFAVDFGETLKSTVMKKLPYLLAQDQSNYIVECSLSVNPVKTTWNDETKKRFLDLVESGNEIVAKLEFQRSPKLVDLIVDGASLNSTLVDENLAEWKSHLVTISHANSLSEFFIQEQERMDELFDLAEKLEKADGWETVDPVIDNFVVAQFEDELWYRAVVVKIEEGAKYVHFVDYGNESACSQFRALPDFLKLIPNFASRCTAHEVPDELNEKFLDLVSSANGSFSVYYLNRVEPMPVLLFYNDVAIENVLRGNKAEVTEVPVAETSIKSVVYDSVVVCYINSPSSFYVQSEVAPLESIANTLVNIENAAVAKPVVGKIAAALFPEDGIWYRVKVTDVSDNSIKVLFIDYGNSCVVEELRQLPEGAQEIPALAKHCAFTLPTGLEQWPDIAKQRFAELTCEGNTIFKLNLLEEGDPAYVDLQDDGVNVADELATLCKADLTATPLLSKTSESTVLMSHVESLNEIWIQFQLPQLDEMADEMVNAETFEAIDTVEEGSLVAALFEDDGIWYRAKVTKISDGQYDVLFIDYGNRSSTSSIKSLPADLVKLPALAKCCQLKDFMEIVEIANHHVEAIVVKLKEMADAGLTFTLRELVETDDVNYVSLTYENNKDLTTEMLAFYNSLVLITAPVRPAQFEDAVEEKLGNEITEPAQNVKKVFNVNAVESTEIAKPVEETGSENATDTEKVLETVSGAYEQTADPIQQEHSVVSNGVGKITDEKIEQVVGVMESEVVKPVVTEKETVVHLCGEGEQTSSQNGECEPFSNHSLGVESVLIQNTEEMVEKVHESVNSAIPTDDLLGITTNPVKIVADDFISFESQIERSKEEMKYSDMQNVAYREEVEEVEESIITPEKNLQSRIYLLEVGVDTSPTETSCNTPQDTSLTLSELTPDYKTPLSKFPHDADDSYMEELSQDDEDFHPDHFESAIGPAVTGSPFSTPGDRSDESELMDTSLESNGDPQTTFGVIEEPVDRSATIILPPLAEAEEFDDSEVSDSTSVVGQGEACASAHEVPKSKSVQLITSFAPSYVQFADADETNADQLADLFSGMVINDSPRQTTLEPEIESRDDTVTLPKVSPIEKFNLVELRKDENVPTQFKSDAVCEKKSAKVEPEIVCQHKDILNEMIGSPNLRSKSTINQPLIDVENPSESSEVTVYDTQSNEKCGNVTETSIVDDVPKFSETNEAVEIFNVCHTVENKLESNVTECDVSSVKINSRSNGEDQLSSDKSTETKSSDELFTEVEKIQQETRTLLASSSSASTVSETGIVSTCLTLVTSYSTVTQDSSVSSVVAQPITCAGGGSSTLEDTLQTPSTVADESSTPTDVAYSLVCVKNDIPPSKNIAKSLVYSDALTCENVSLSSIIDRKQQDTAGPFTSRLTAHRVESFNDGNSSATSFPLVLSSTFTLEDLTPSEISRKRSLAVVEAGSPALKHSAHFSVSSLIKQHTDNLGDVPTDEKFVSNAADTVPALLEELADVAGSTPSAETPEDDSKSPLSSNVAEVPCTSANVAHQDTSCHQQPPQVIIIGGAPISDTSTMDPAASSAPAIDQDDNSSEYYDSCTEDRIAQLSDDEQPKSSVSSTSDEMSFASDGEKDDKADLCVVSHVNTPENFFVQLVADEETLRDMEKQMSEHKAAELAPEEVCLVDCDADKEKLCGAEIDNRLYRVRVLKADSVGEHVAEYTVFCVDYGRVCKTLKLFSLPASLRNARALALSCAIRPPCYLPAWPINICHEFEKLTAKKQSKFRLKVREHVGDVAFVDLLTGSRSIVQRMKTLCEEFSQGDAPTCVQDKSSVVDELKN